MEVIINGMKIRVCRTRKVGRLLRESKKKKKSLDPVLQEEEQKKKTLFNETVDFLLVLNILPNYTVIH